ncbi:MAG: hypothetical protein AB8G05_07435 [Oligoflexales bacterium]
MQYTAIGTEALRKVCQEESINKKLKKLPIPVRIISQEQEALLGHHTAKYLSKKETRLTSWDHGGGSFQITCEKSPESLFTYQGSVGSIPATQLFKQFAEASATRKHPAPISKKALRLYQIALRKQLPVASSEFMECLQKSNRIIAIGGLSSVPGIASRIQGNSMLESGKLWQGILGLLGNWNHKHLTLVWTKKTLKSCSAISPN